MTFATNNYPAYYTGWCLFGVIIYGLYLIIDTKLIMGGNRYKIMADEYIVCCMILYTDIIMIFIYLLALLGGKK